MSVLVNSSVAHSEPIATFKRAEAIAVHKLGLINSAGQNDSKEIQIAIVQRQPASELTAKLDLVNRYASVAHQNLLRQHH